MDRTRHESFIDRLEEFVADDRIGSFDVTVWGDQLPLDRSPRTDTGRRLCRLLGLFERWAERSTRSIRPFFETRQSGTELLDSADERQVMSLPEFALAEFHDDELMWVSPHRAKSSLHTVEDHLDAIASWNQHQSPQGRPLDVSVPREQPESPDAVGPETTDVASDLQR